MKETKRIGVFGWGIVAPKSPDIETFARNLEKSESWLTPFDGFGPSNFLVGEPEFDFERYRPWFDARFAPSKYGQLDDKMGPTTKYAIGSFIQSLEQNPGIEEYLQKLNTSCHVYVGTGLGELTVQHRESIRYEKAVRRWNAFWADPERNESLAAHLSGEEISEEAPASPEEFETGTDDWLDARDEWNAYWARRSETLRQYLDEASAIQAEPVPPSSGTAKLGTIRQKLSRIRALNKKWGCPEEPWAAVSANLLWNIANIPASQISMIGRIMGPAVAPVAACASFGIAIRLGMNAIELGHAKAAVIGMADPPPHPLTISGFYNANVVAADKAVSRPMTGLKGTHVAGGSCVWIIGDADELTAQGFEPLGLEIVSVGTSSDAHHIITPSKEGPQLAIRDAIATVEKDQIRTWDLHATATPGDSTEIEHALEALHPDVLFTARKGTFGHGMSVGGGWELTAQHLGVARGELYPTVLAEDDIHPDIREHSARFVHLESCSVNHGYSGKLSMGIGGINSCVISRPWSSEERSS
ncbi:MAG: beta-ketoacyl synthase N-terminal-like domain-containing protein [Thermoanaerobaculia bacterium]|nr:beta-ketoacyl synthase N-terminal-like domain-containing protein [Thermoanaerobaculia bacterium]